jgi:hypothetical protein
LLAVTENEIMVTLRGLGTIYDKEISEDLLQIWCSVLQGVTSEELTRAVRVYVTAAENVFFPKPGQIHAIAKGIVDLESEAVQITDSIFYCLRSYGPDPLGIDRTKKKIGEIGWLYIQSIGGWEAFVISVRSEDDVPIIKSQVRKSIMGLLQRKRSGFPDRIHEKLEAVEAFKRLGIKMKELT